MKPKVLITIDTYDIGGPGKLILQFLEHGGRELCTPLVAGFWRGPERRWQFREAVDACGAPFAVLPQKFAFDPLVIGKASRLARANGIQVLESHGYKSHVVCLALKKLLGLPWAAYVHGWTSENLKVRLYNRLDRWIVRYADRIVPVSRDLGARLRLGKRDQGKLVFIPNAVSPPKPGQDGDVRERFGVHEGDFLLGVVGRLSPEKGHLQFIEAFRAVCAAHGNVKAILVGDGQERGAITAALRQYGLEEKVILAGYQADVSPYYRSFDLIVLPSLREGMPMAALEAMAFARPVVATSAGGIPEVVLDGLTGWLVRPGEPSELAGAITAALDNRHEMAQRGAAGKRRVESEFSATGRARAITDLYQDMLGR